MVGHPQRSLPCRRMVLPTERLARFLQRNS